MLFPLIALGVAALGLAILAIAGPAHRLGMSLSSAYAVMRWAAYLGVAAAVASIATGVLAYRTRQWGRLTVAGLALATAIATCSIGFIWQYRAANSPPIHDVTTDLENPPTFSAVLALRADAPNRLDRSPQLADLQRQGYPDLAPVTAQGRPDQTFDRVLAVAQAQGWDIVTADKSSGHLEATDTTRWFGFVDDIAVRLTPWGTGTRIDVRSVSRTGTGDAGRNADRIRMFLREVQK